MQYGITLPNFGLGGDARTLGEVAVAAEESGWHGLFIWDHLQWPNVEPCVDPWVALGFIASQTNRIRIGTLITPLPRRDIAKLARETVSVDRLSGGRLVLGAGLGFPTIPEYSGFGHETDLKIRGEMLDEGLELLAALWSGAPVKHEGKHYQVQCEGFAPPVQSPRIPVWVAGMWPSVKPFRRAAQWDGVVPVSRKVLEREQLGPAEIAEILEHIGRARSSTEPYAVALSGSTADAEGRARLVACAEAGANWWIEDGTRLMRSRETLLDRIKQGPPRLPE